MVTALEACNKISIFAGEREYAQFENKPASIKARVCLKESLLHISNLTRWKCLETTSNFPDASSWNADTVTIPNFGVLLDVMWQYDTAFVSLWIQKTKTLDQYTRNLPYSGPVEISAEASVPGTLYIENTNKIKVNPYPNTDADRARLYFVYYRVMNHLFKNETDDVDIPVELESLVYSYGALKYCLIHTHDLNIAASLEESVRMAKEQAVSTNKMYANNNKNGF